MKVSLAWTPGAGDQGFNVYRSDDGGVSFTKIAASLPASPATYDDTTVQGGKSYVYQVTGFDASGESAPSNQATASVPSGPGAPSNLTATVS